MPRPRPLTLHPTAATAAFVAIGAAALLLTGPLSAVAEFPDDPAICIQRPDRAPIDRFLLHDLADPAAPLQPAPDRATGPAARPPAPDVEVWADPERDLTFVRWMGVVADPLSEEFPFVVEEGTVGITIRAEEVGLGRYVSVELIGPDGTVLSCLDCPEAIAASEIKPGRGTVQMPSTDRPGWELEPGDYSFRVRTSTIGGFAPVGPLTVTATFRTEAAFELERRLDLNFVYLPDCGLDTAYALSSIHFQHLVEGLDKWLQMAGLRLGRVTHVDYDRPEFSSVGTWEEVGVMFRSSDEIGRPRALNVYCMAGFEGVLGGAVGLSGGIPGPVMNGTGDSGIAIKTSPFPVCVPIHDTGSCLSAYLSLFMHEIGHYLGFWHTTETDGQNADPFFDTPRCLTYQNLRSCPDFPYVMFPMIHSGNVLWSPNQLRVTSTHPILRTVPRIGGDPPDPAIPAIPAVRPEEPLAGVPAEGFPDGHNADRLAAAAQARPNPFRETVEISWGTPTVGAEASVRIYNVAGQRVRELTASGSRVQWDGRSAAGDRVPAGIYFARLENAGRVETVRVVKAR